MNKFLKDLEAELKKLNVNPKEIKEILEDHKEMIEAAKQEGLSEDELDVKFGDPKKVALEINEDSQSTTSKIDLEGIESLAQFDVSKFDLVKGFTNDLDNLEFKVSLVNDDFIFSDYDGEEIHVYQKGIKDIEEYEITLENKILEIKRKKSVKINSFFSFNKKSGCFLVLVPKEMKSNKFNYHTVNGEVSINKLVVNNFALNSTNGDIKFSNVDLGVSKLSLVNGDVEMAGFKAISVDISLVNGDVKFDNGIIEKGFDINSVSGNSNFNNVECDNASFKTVSGDMLGKNFYVNEVSLKSVSGDINIENEDKSRHIKVLNKKTISGDININ